MGRKKQDIKSSILRARAERRSPIEIRHERVLDVPETEADQYPGGGASQWLRVREERIARYAAEGCLGQPIPFEDAK